MGIEPTPLLFTRAYRFAVRGDYQILYPRHVKIITYVGDFINTSYVMYKYLLYVFY